jgi:lipoprotein-anchoring transpeptidase ErfK/SrfK
MENRTAPQLRKPGGLERAARGGTSPAPTRASADPIAVTRTRSHRLGRGPLAVTGPAAAGLTALLALSGCHHVPPSAPRVAAQPQGAPPSEGPAAEELPPADERALYIELGDQSFTYFEDGRLVRSGEVSAGAPEHPTPTGDFRVLSKQRDKVSRSYTNHYNEPTPMPYSLQFLGPYYVHEGYMPGYPDSHGCVRLHYEDARFLFARMKVGDEVKITDSYLAGTWHEAGDGLPKPNSYRKDWLSLDDPRRLW